MKKRSFLYVFALTLICIFGLQSCAEESSTTLSFTSSGGVVSPSTAPVVSPLGTTTSAIKTFTQGTSQISVEKAALVLRRIQFRKTSGPEADFKTNAFVVDIKLDNTKNIVAVSQLPFATYDRIKFDIHKLDPIEIAAIDLSKNPEFTEFVKDNGYSIYVKGTYDNDTTDGISAKSFEFKNRLNETQVYFLRSPLEIKEGQTSIDVNLTVDLDKWFLVGGQLVDPVDQNNRSTIEQNIKASIKHF
ncbi:MAG: hypothetical protein HYW47_00075 [Deltaproteobacteria bacterium]|nr:hypothetical protein [Deltaproteobacteria bacterium]